MTLDAWLDDQIEVVEAAGGNSSADTVYEKSSPTTSVKKRANLSWRVFIQLLCM